MSEQDIALKEVSSLILGRWKWIDGELYDLSSDPGEKVDLSSDRPDVANQMEARLRTILDSRKGLLGERVVPDAASEARLRALGYLD